ncbi:MAG TPA: amidohydrolase family protein [Candidatus Acidoferrales bacterium]|nr:amidohydrolase family protein [Candidatus Acidoferrales bacterium]
MSRKDKYARHKECRVRWLAIVSLHVLFFAFSARAVAQNVPAELIRYPEIVIHNAKVHTADKDGPDYTIAEALAVREGRILYVGNNAEALKLAGPETLKIDAKGRTVIPGIIASDGDNAFAAGDLYKYTQIGLRLIGGGRSLRVPPTKEAIIDKIKELVAQAKPGEPVFLRFRDELNGIMWAFTRHDLDLLSPNNPLTITIGGSDVVVNTKMLETAFASGLRKDHLGVIKDASGQPTGQLFGQAAGLVMWNLRPYPEEAFENFMKDQLELQQKFVENGKTTVTGHATGLDMTLWNVMYHRGQLYLRFRPAMDFVRSNPLAGQFLKRVGTLVNYGLGETVKIVGLAPGPADGAIDDPYGISTLEPMRLIPDIIKGDRFPTGVFRWTGEQWTGKGSLEQLSTEEKKDTELQTLLDARRYGWNFSGVHNMGSKGIQAFLSGVENAVKGQKLMVPELVRPHNLDHNVAWYSTVIEQAKKAVEPMRFGLAVREIFNPRLVDGHEVIYIKFGDKAPHLQPVKTLIDEGIPVSVEIGERDAFWMMEKLVTRTDDKGRVRGGQYALDRKTALLMATRWGARFIGEEKNLGSIELGKFADIVILGTDYLNIPADQISKMPVMMTLIDGKIVYTAPNFAAELGSDYKRFVHPAAVRPQ